MREDPLSGHLFAFINRRATQIKVLYFDRTGLCVWSKRLEQGRLIAAWRQEFNEVRPHSSCHWMPPEKCAVLHRQHTEGKQGPTDSINLSPGLPAN